MDKYISHYNESCGYKGITHLMVFSYGSLEFRLCSRRCLSYFTETLKQLRSPHQQQAFFTVNPRRTEFQYTIEMLEN